jgi:hypothetical protein
MKGFQNTVAAFRRLIAAIATRFQYAGKPLTGIRTSHLAQAMWSERARVILQVARISVARAMSLQVNIVTVRAALRLRRVYWWRGSMVRSSTKGVDSNHAWRKTNSGRRR